MNVSLSKQWEKFITNSVNSGRYHSASEVIRAGLRLLEHYEQGRQIEQVALEALGSGKVRKLTKADISAARRAVRKKLLERN